MYGLERVNQQLGEFVVVQGAGALGLYAVAVAKARGAARVIAIDGIPERLELAAAFGADAVIDINELTTEKDRVKAVRTLTDGQGRRRCGRGCRSSGGHRRRPENARTVRPLCRDRQHQHREDLRIRSVPLRVRQQDHGGVSLYDPAVLSRALAFLDEYQHRLPFDRLAAACYSLDDINAAFAAAETKRDVRASIVP